MTAALRRAVRRGLWTVLPALPRPILNRLLPSRERLAADPVPAPAPPPSNSVRLFIGPSNMAGQGWQWARAAERHLRDVGARSMSAGDRSVFGFDVDERIHRNVYRWSGAWRARQIRHVRSFTHALIEAGRPLFGDPFGRPWTDDATLLARRGLEVAAVLHGSEIRLPSRHAAGSAWSPFRSDLGGATRILEARAARLHRELDDFPHPVFVATPDLLLERPTATWLPVVVDPGRWAAAANSPFAANRRLTVVHAPSSTALKGTALIDPVLERLARAQLIDYRRVDAVPASEMPRLYGSADIVVDQLQMGIYGVAACEAMASGRLVVSQVREQVREHVHRASGRELPIVEVTPDTLEPVLRDIVANVDDYRDRAAAGPAFVAAVHDGRRTAAALADFLGTETLTGSAVAAN